MLATYWWGLVAFGFAMAMTFLVIQPEERVYVTASTAGVAWLLAALTAPGVERMTRTGDVVAAPPGVIVQLVLGVLGLLSLAVVILYKAGLYPPPETDDLPDDDTIKA